MGEVTQDFRDEAKDDDEHLSFEQLDIRAKQLGDVVDRENPRDGESAEVADPKDMDSAYGKLSALLGKERADFIQYIIEKSWASLIDNFGKEAILSLRDVLKKKLTELQGKAPPFSFDITSEEIGLYNAQYYRNTNDRSVEDGARRFAAALNNPDEQITCEFISLNINPMTGRDTGGQPNKATVTVRVGIGSKS